MTNDNIMILDHKIWPTIISHHDVVPSAKRVHNELEGSTMLLLEKIHDISMAMFDVANC